MLIKLVGKSDFGFLALQFVHVAPVLRDERKVPLVLPAEQLEYSSKRVSVTDWMGCDS